MKEKTVSEYLVTRSLHRDRADSTMLSFETNFRQNTTIALKFYPQPDSLTDQLLTDLSTLSTGFNPQQFLP